MINGWADAGPEVKQYLASYDRAECRITLPKASLTRLTAEEQLGVDAAANNILGALVTRDHTTTPDDLTILKKVEGMSFDLTGDIVRLHIFEFFGELLITGPNVGEPDIPLI